ncbi:MAG: hypothetical protein ABL920_09870 [Methylotenera sp.]
MSNKPLNTSALGEFMAKLKSVLTSNENDYHRIKSARAEAEIFDRIDERDRRERVLHIINKFTDKGRQFRTDNQKRQWLRKLGWISRTLRVPETRNGEWLDEGFTFSHQCLNWSLNQDSLAIFCVHASTWISKNDGNFKLFISEFEKWGNGEIKTLDGGGQASAATPTQSTKPVEKAIEPAPEPVAEAVDEQEQVLNNDEIDAQIEKLNEQKQRNKSNEKVADYDFK